MASRNPSRRKSIFAKRRYWYHISTTLKGKEVFLKPWDNSKGFNRAYSEPDVERICVAPSVAHCLTAVPYSLCETFHVYRTKSPVKAKEAHGVFDSNVTLEGWIQKPCTFVKVGVLKFEDVEKGEKVEHVAEEAASGSSPRQSGRVLSWWKRHHLRRYIK